MSHSYFQNLWVEAQADLRLALGKEKKIGPAGIPIPTSAPERLAFFTEMAHTYYNWMELYKKFDEAYDQIVHPQKLPLIRKLLDVVIARLYEIHRVLVGTELSEVLYFDDIMHFYGWMPSELDLPIPKYYIFHDTDGKKEREALLEDLARARGEQAGEKASADKQKQEQEKIVAEYRKKLKKYQEAQEQMQHYTAIAIIQNFERNRQASERVAMAKYMEMEEENRRKRKFKAITPSKMDPEKAAIIIQKIVRGFLARRRVRKIREKEMKFLGLMWTPMKKGDEKWVPYEKIREMEDEIKKNAARRRRVRWRYQKNYEEADELIESRMRLFEGPEMAERMKWQIRTWLLHIKETTGEFPVIPKPTLGGTMGIFCPDRLPPEIQEKILEAQSGKGKKKKGKKNKKKKKDDKKKKKKKKRKKQMVVTKLEEMGALEEAIEYNQEYNIHWRQRDETNNPEQKHEDEIIIQEKRALVGQETRNKVDVLMKAELKWLKKALKGKKGGKKGKGKGKKGKGKKGKGKGKKGKKGKKKDKKKKKKFKDLTPNRSWQSLFEELVKSQIILNYPKISFDDLVGDYNLVNETIRKYYVENPNQPIVVGPRGDEGQFKIPFDVHPPPSFGDIKRVVKNVCILPLGSETVRELIDFPKGVLIAGPPGSGKKSLVYAMCAEIGATLFDVTPRVELVQKFPEKDGLTLLINHLNKMGRICQPSVILIDKIEKVFGKKSKDDPTEAARIKKQLKKFLKIIGPEDRMLLVGLTTDPWLAKAKPLKKTFDKFIWIPKPDHGTRLTMWQNCLGDSIPDFESHMNLSLLSKLSDNWTLGQIKRVAASAVKRHTSIIKAEAEEQTKTYEFNYMDVLAGKLLFKPLKLGRTQLKMDNIIDELAMTDPIFVEQNKAWNKWFRKTPLQKLRVKAFKPGAGAGGKGKKGKGKKAGAGKKGKKK